MYKVKKNFLKSTAWWRNAYYTYFRTRTGSTPGGDIFIKPLRKTLKKPLRVCSPESVC